MLKITGCVLVLCGTSGMAYTLVCAMRQELAQLEELRKLLKVLEQELSYCRCPLPELLSQLSERIREPFGGILRRTGEALLEYREAEVGVLWKTCCEDRRGGLMLREEELRMLMELGETFAYTSLDASTQLLRLDQERLTETLQRKRQEYGGRRKLCCCACYTVGLAVIILLL